MRQDDAAPGPHGARHGIGVHGLHADHLDRRLQALYVGGDARDQAAASDADEDRVDGAHRLAQDLHADRALSGDDVRVVVGMDEREALAALDSPRLVVGLAVGVAGQHDLRAQRLHRIHLDLRRGHRHHDHGATPELACREGDTLRMVPRGGGDDTASERRVGELRHLVECTAQLEGEHLLHVLAFEHDAVPEPRRQVGSELERRLLRDIVDAGGEDLLEVVGRHRKNGRLRAGGASASLAGERVM